MFSLRKEDGLTLYARKVLIQEYTKDLLPEYFRFIQGVVDSEDIPLNVSREMVQATPLMQKLKKVLTGRTVAMLTDLAKDADAYATFWEHFGHFIKEGIATDMADRETLYPLLRFQTTKSDGALRSLNDYVAGMKSDQKKIYFILGDDPRSLARSPHLDYFRSNGYEVILLGDLIDSFMVMGVPKYEGFDLVNVAAADLDLPGEPEQDGEEQAEDVPAGAAIEGLVATIKEVLGDRIGDVRTTKRLSGSIARLVDPEGALGQEMQRVYKMMERDFETPKKVLEINPKHPTIATLAERDPGDPLTPVLIEQIYENALLIEGLHPDPAGMIQRIEEIMKAALS
jgi:molecular chaperone HtpG